MSQLLRGGMDGANFASNLIHRQYQYDQGKVRERERVEDRNRNINRQDKQDDIAAIDRKSRIEREKMQAELYRFNLEAAKDKKNVASQVNMLRGFKQLLGGNRTEASSKLVIDGINTAFNPVINQGEGGKKKVSDIIPASQIKEGQEGYVLELEVDPGDGRPKYTAPMTQGASTSPDDPLQIVEDEDFFDMFTTLEAALRDSGYGGTVDEMDRLLGAKIHALGGADEGKEGLAKMQKEYALKTNLENVKNKNRLGQITAASKAKSSPKPTAQVQVVEWMMSNMKGPKGEPLTANEAWSMAQTAKSNPQRAVQSMFESLRESQENALLFNSKAKVLSDEQLAGRAKQMVAMLSQDQPTQSGGVLGEGNSSERDELDALLDSFGVEDYR